MIFSTSLPLHALEEPRRPFSSIASSFLAGFVLLLAGSPETAWAEITLPPKDIWDSKVQKSLYEAPVLACPAQYDVTIGLA